MNDTTEPQPMYTLERLQREPSTVGARELEDGRVVAVHAQLFGYLLTISTPESLRAGARNDAWEYGTGGPNQYAGRSEALAKAMDAYREWDGEGEPPDWTRHVPTGRRRPRGDEAKEYLRR